MIPAVLRDGRLVVRRCRRGLADGVPRQTSRRETSLSATEPRDEPAGLGTGDVVRAPQAAGYAGWARGAEPAVGDDVAPWAVKLSIVMPVYNEEHTIVRAVEEVLRTPYPCEFELIVVDDGSTDGTGELLAGLHDDQLVVHHHANNRGKGAALRTAVSLARGSHVVPFDADLEYAAEDIPRMLDPVLKGRCAVVYGVRLFGFNTVYHSLRYAVGNRFLTGLANVLFDACLSDLHTCLKLIPLPMLTALDLTEERFGFDTEVTALLLRSGVRPFEVPVSYYGRSHAHGKKIKMRDALVCAWVLLKVRLRRLRTPAPRHRERATEMGGPVWPVRLRVVTISGSADEMSEGKAGRGSLPCPGPGSRSSSVRPCWSLRSR
jgi:dolichol-phosphate hexosyltransferase